MLTQLNKLIIDTINLDTKTISIRKDCIILDDGVEVARSKDRRAFVPGQIDDVKDYIGIEQSPEITYLESLWTQEVIDSYNLSIQE